jgi:chemotaxis response regulator CheB
MVATRVVGRKDTQRRSRATGAARKTRAASPSPKNPPKPLSLIVGIGASAGGLDAFKTFLANMPPDSGMGFVLVQHLDPHHKSMLVELLAAHTAMLVSVATDDTLVAANHVFRRHFDHQGRPPRGDDPGSGASPAQADRHVLRFAR